MLNVSFRPAAPLAWFGLVVCAGFVWQPVQADTAPAQAVPAPFKQYQAWRDEPLQDWRQANQRVGEIGGWRTYLRESQSGDGSGMEHGEMPPGGMQPGGQMNHGQ
jgi:hypothetical protein